MSLGPTISFIIRSVKLYVFPLISTGLGIAVLALLPQGIEVLRTINDSGLMDTRSDDFTLAIAFTLSLALWSPSNWYSSQQQHNFNSPGRPPLAGPSADNWHVWFPRLFGPIRHFLILTRQEQQTADSRAWRLKNQKIADSSPGKSRCRTRSLQELPWRIWCQLGAGSKENRVLLQTYVQPVQSLGS